MIIAEVHLEYAVQKINNAKDVAGLGNEWHAKIEQVWCQVRDLREEISRAIPKGQGAQTEGA